MYKRSDGLYESIRVIDGHRVAFRGKTQQAVKDKIYDYRQRGTKGPTFQEVGEMWRLNHFEKLSPNSLKNYRPAYKRAVEAFGKERIKEISPKQVDNFIKKFAGQGMAQNTVKNQLLIVRLICDYACVEGHLESNPAAYVSIPKGLSKNARRFPTDEEIKKVKANIDAPFGLFFYFILYTGCRLGEALALRWKDVDFDEKVIHITKSVYYAPSPQIKEPKSEAGKRDIILLNGLAEVLLPLKGGEDELLFSINGELIGNKQSWLLFENYRKETGVKVTPHELRHGYATMLYEADIDIKTAQYLMGHAQSSTTLDIYTTLRSKQKMKAAEALNNYISTQ